jgi:hypothetical protein
MGFLSITLLSDALSWSLCFGAYKALERGLCRGFPGIRTLCRGLSVGTAAIAAAFGLWALASAGKGAGALLDLAVVNHGFASGIYAQTTIRSLLLVRWLWRTLPAYAAGFAGLSEHHVMQSLDALTGIAQPR